MANKIFNSLLNTSGGMPPPNSANLLGAWGVWKIVPSYNGSALIADNGTTLNPIGFQPSGLLDWDAEIVDDDDVRCNTLYDQKGELSDLITYSKPESPFLNLGLHDLRFLDIEFFESLYAWNTIHVQSALTIHWYGHLEINKQQCLLDYGDYFINLGGIAFGMHVDGHTELHAGMHLEAIRTERSVAEYDTALHLYTLILDLSLDDENQVRFLIDGIEQTTIATYSIPLIGSFVTGKCRIGTSFSAGLILNGGLKAMMILGEAQDSEAINNWLTYCQYWGAL